MRTNLARHSVTTHEGAPAQAVSPYAQLRRSLLTCLLFEDTFYEKGSGIATRIAELVPQVSPDLVADLAIEARSKMQLRHAPLFLVRELAKRKGCGPHVERALASVIQRADEMGEFLALYWKEKRQPLSSAVKRALRAAFPRFNAYQLGKYDRDAAVKLRDVLFLVHPKPDSDEQAATWKQLVDGTLESPDTWEVALSAGADKRETFERLLREGKLGGLAVLRNLRNMIQAGVDERLIDDRLSAGIKRALPFRFITAARHAPRLEPSIEKAMLNAIEGLTPIPGKTFLLIDVSGSMDEKLSARSESTRLEAACALAILVRETAASAEVWTFSNLAVEVPPRRGFALRDAIVGSQHHAGTHLGSAVRAITARPMDRLIVITDEQSHDPLPAWTSHCPAYVINVAPYKNGLGYGNGWTHIDGWSERVLDFVAESEAPNG